MSSPPAEGPQREPSQHRHPGHHHQQLRRASSRALKASLGILTVFFFVEVAGGILTNSLALISDAAHLLTDVAAVALALLAQIIAARPSSALRSYGYRRVEILAALANGLTLLAVAVYIGYEASHRILVPPPVESWPMILVAVVGLGAQLLTTLILHRAKEESLNVRGAYIHAMTDAVQSVGVVMAGVVMLLTGWYIVDPVISLLIGLLIVYSGGRIIVEATHVLIEGTPRELDLGQVAELINRTPGVRRVTDLHAWSLTSGYNALTAHVEALPDPADADHEALCKKLTRELCRRFSIHHVTLQIERECEQCLSGCGDWIEGDRERR